jgi:ferritin-like metal-binding protein YciE
LWKEVENFELKELFRARGEAIQEHAERLESVLSKLDASVSLPTTGARGVEAEGGLLSLLAERGGHPVTQGLLQEHQLFMRLDPSQAVVEIHDLMEAGRIEHTQMMACDELIGLAQELQEADVVALLKQERREEEANRGILLDWMHTLVREYREGRRKAA